LNIDTNQSSPRIAELVSPAIILRQIMNKYFHQFLELLEKSTKDIKEHFMKFEAEGLLDGFMERTYAYELYHQLRSAQDQLGYFDFVINAEPQKSRTHFFKCLTKRIEQEASDQETEEEFQKRVMPDILVHIPNKINENIAIVEIKPDVNKYKEKGFSKDIRVLKEFTTGSQEAAGYYKGIMLFYKTDSGANDESEIRNFYGPKIKEKLGDNWEEYIGKILLMWHPGIGQSIIDLKWEAAEENQ
jgi:hypothetical protein